MQNHHEVEPIMLPVRRAAKRIGVSYNTVLRHPADFFPTHRLGTHLYVASSDLAAWITKRTSQNGHSRAARA